MSRTVLEGLMCMAADLILTCRVRKSKTNISLVPRVVARAQEGAEPEELPADKLSNSDFRKLLAKK